MDVIALSLSIVSLGALVVAGLFLRGYLPAYFAEKGKNVASKEDLSHLTDVVERVKSLHAAQMERLRADISMENEVLERRRLVYEQMCSALRVFISGHGGTSEAKERFHAAYAAAWLWSSDPVLGALNRFIEIQVQHLAVPGSVNQQRMKEGYAAVIVAMRKDVGFASSTIAASDYQFVTFV